MKLLSVAVVLLALGACSNDPEGVDQDLQRRVAVYVDDGNCESLQAEFDHADDSKAMRYIDDAMRDSGCY